MKTFHPWLTVLALWVAAFSISCTLLGMPRVSNGDTGSTSVAGRLLGGSQIALAHQFYDTADQYFHRGVPHLHDVAFSETLFQRLEEDLSPVVHVHRKGRELEEIMPWLRLAIRMDPHRAETYLVAAFWLSHEARRPNVALEILQEAQVAIPFNHEIQLEKGRLLLRQHRLDEATAAFEAGLAFWPGAVDPQSHEGRVDRASLLLYRSLLHEAAGRTEPAISDLAEIVKMFPERVSLQHRIEELRTGEGSTLSASRFWKQLISEEDEARQGAICPLDTAHDHED